MIGMILVTHGRLAEEFVHAMEHVVGVQSDVATVCIGPNDDMEARRKEIAQAIRKVDSGSGAVILTDLFGGTPSNLAISLLKKGKTEVIAGFGLPGLARIWTLPPPPPLLVTPGAITSPSPLNFWARKHERSRFWPEQPWGRSLPRGSHRQQAGPACPGQRQICRRRGGNGRVPGASYQGRTQRGWRLHPGPDDARRSEG
jgi:PTS system mannose-specific IIA component